MFYVVLYKYPLFDDCDALYFQVRSDSGTEPPSWSFNLSHQGDYAVLAAEQGGQVGVDIMKNTMPGKCSENVLE